MGKYTLVVVALLFLPITPATAIDSSVVPEHVESYLTRIAKGVFLEKTHLHYLQLQIQIDTWQCIGDFNIYTTLGRSRAKDGRLTYTINCDDPIEITQGALIEITLLTAH